MQHTHYCNEPLEVFSVVSRICYRHRTYSAKSDRYEATPGNGRHADDLEWAAGGVGLTAPLKLGTCVRTKGCFACIDVTVCSRILHRQGCFAHFVPLSSVSLSALTLTRNDRLNKCLKLHRKHVSYNVRICNPTEILFKRIPLQNTLFMETRERLHNTSNNYDRFYIVTYTSEKKCNCQEDINDTLQRTFIMDLLNFI